MSWLWSSCWGLSWHLSHSTPTHTHTHTSSLPLLLQVHWHKQTAFIESTMRYNTTTHVGERGWNNKTRTYASVCFCNSGLLLAVYSNQCIVLIHHMAQELGSQWALNFSFFSAWTLSHIIMSSPPSLSILVSGILYSFRLSLSLKTNNTQMPRFICCNTQMGAGIICHLILHKDL